MGTNRNRPRRGAKKRRDETAAPGPRNRPTRLIAALAAVGFAVATAGVVFMYSAGTFATSDAGSAAEAPACTASIETVAIDRGSASRVLSKPPAYTQGLLFADDELYESTGIRGRSAIYRLDPREGTRTELFALDRDLFGEGLARHGDRFYQLTWRAGLVFIYDSDNRQRLERTATVHREGEGWGLTDLANELVLSDGSDKLSFVDPQSFTVTRQVQVRLANQPLPKLNELESVGGTILANVYGDSSVVAIDPANGCVTMVIDASGLVAGVAEELKALPETVCPGPCSPWDFVLNGIAYDADAGELYVTGKNWPLIFVYRDLIG